jgi:quinol monooxygenase YgiN
MIRIQKTVLQTLPFVFALTVMQTDANGPDPANRQQHTQQQQVIIHPGLTLDGDPIVRAIEPDMMVRMAEIDVFPEFLDEYKLILKEEAGASVRLEPGVVAIFPMYEQKKATQIVIVEIYANKAAYESHLKTSHFQRYKTSTMKMVKSLSLMEMESIDKEMMLSIFKKMK